MAPQMRRICAALFSSFFLIACSQAGTNGPKTCGTGDKATGRAPYSRRINLAPAGVVSGLMRGVSPKTHRNRNRRGEVGLHGAACRLFAADYMAQRRLLVSNVYLTSLSHSHEYPSQNAPNPTLKTTFQSLQTTPRRQGANPNHSALCAPRLRQGVARPFRPIAMAARVDQMRRMLMYTVHKRRPRKPGTLLNRR